MDQNSNVIITPSNTGEEPTVPEGYALSSEEPSQPQFTGMEDHGAIGVFRNYVKYDFCDAIIAGYESWHKKKYYKEESTKITEVHKSEDGKRDIDHTLDCMGDGSTQFPKQGAMGRKDTALYLEVCDPSLAMGVNQAVGGAFEHYIKKYPGLMESNDPVSSWTCKVQRTDPGGGYHIWHCENGSFIYRDRVLTWMIYLNDIPYESGGATDFFHQKISFQPTKGTLVLWPACYTHMHRGAFLTGDKSKYIATGWFLREPGQVTNRLIGEATGQLQPQDKMNPNF